MQTGERKAAPPASAAAEKSDVYKWVYVVVGLAVLFGSTAIPAPGGMKPAAVRTLGVMLTSILWWVTETFPIPITALMIPVMVHGLGIMPLSEALKESFGNGLIPFMIGVLGLSAALNASGLGKRITYRILTLAGTGTTRVVAVYFWMSFLISMFIDDVAVVAMMLPLVLGLLKTIDAKAGSSNLGKALMMAIMFGTILGGLCTPAGVSSNIITLAFMANANVHVSFLYWTLISTPIAVAIAAVSGWLIIKMFPPEIERLPYGRDVLEQELKALGALNTKEKTTAVIFLLAVLAWLSSDLTHIPIPFVSLLILAGITLPGVGVFRNWRDLRIEWGGVVLLVGGFVVGIAASKTGLASWVVQKALSPMALLPQVLQPAAVTLLIAVDSLGFSSFGTTASVNVPFIIAYVQHNGFPLLALPLTAGLASSIHFILVTQSPTLMLPYAYGYYSFKDLAKFGAVVTLISAAIMTIGMAVTGMLTGLP
jgi:sodium-dependent dicarboxylate transporter 2/3/5